MEDAFKDVRPVTALGEVKFAGRKMPGTARITMTWRSDSEFSCILYSPIGTPLAGISSGKDGAAVSINNLFVPISPEDSIKKHIAYFDFPFTFRELERIIGGSPPVPALTDMKYDSDSSTDTGCRYCWNRGPDACEMFIERRTGVPLVVNYTRNAGGTKVRLRFARFFKGHFKSIECNAGSNNYFHLLYDTMEETAKAK